MKQKALPNLMTGLTQLQTYFHLMINAHKSTYTVWSIFLIGKTLKQRKEHKWKVLCNNIQKHQGIFFSIIQTKGSSLLFWRRLGEGGYCCNKKKYVPQEKLQHQTSFSLLPIPLHVKKIHISFASVIVIRISGINHFDIQICSHVKTGKVMFFPCSTINSYI